jgi:hypothetical protein
MRQITICLTLCLLVVGCASQRTPPPSCGNFEDSSIQILKRTVVTLGLKSADTTMSFKPNTTTMLFRLEDVLAVLATRVNKVGYLGEEQQMRVRLTTYPPREGFSDLSQYATYEVSYLPGYIAMELLESGKAVVVDPRASGESLPEVVIFNLARPGQRGRATWREVCSMAGDLVLFHLDRVEP